MPVSKFLSKVIYFSYLLLFFVTPFLISTKSYELFEFPKMLFVYGLTVVVIGAWVGKMFLKGKLWWRKSWVDPIFILIIVTQLVSTLLSLHPHTSWFGYYSRFHGGMFSTLCYTLLTWGFIQNAKKEWVQNIFLASLASASIVCLYAVAEHFGIDAHMWVQDVQNRVFSTLGQPNWLAAWVGALLPIAIAWTLNPPKTILTTIIPLNLLTISLSYAITYFLTKNPLPFSGWNLAVLTANLLVFNALVFPKLKIIHQKLEKYRSFTFLLLFVLFVATIFFTKSRSGILALFASTIIFAVSWGINSSKVTAAKSRTALTTLVGSLVLLLLIIGTEWTPTFSQLLGKDERKIKNPLAQTVQKSSLPHAETISDSTDIRKVVWKGALKVMQRYPIFGSGTETFAYAYYNVRPQEHNHLSEWDFLYNKAHNEYLNYLANNGIAGTTAVLLLITAIVWIVVRSQWQFWTKMGGVGLAIAVILALIFPSLVQKISSKLLIYPPLVIPLGICLFIALLLWLFIAKKYLKGMEVQKTQLNSILLASLTSIIITNFYGFSVVTVALWFFFLPVFFIVTQKQWVLLERKLYNPLTSGSVNLIHISFGTFILFLCFFMLINIFFYYKADQYYSLSRTYLSQGGILEASKNIDKALELRGFEADYNMQKALVASQTAFTLWYKDSSDSTDLIKTLSQQAEQSTVKALKANPVHLNIYKSALKVYLTLAAIDKQYYPKAIQVLETATTLSPTDPQLIINLGMLLEQQGQIEQAEAYLQKAVALKPNYRRGWIYLAQFYQNQEMPEKASEAYRFILENIDPTDKTSLEYFEETRKES
ncbi:MAG: O-antigen ligase family protein [Patescibacteria group bacterium]|jgi:putative inorganic carbon (HCO3(-)) transporter